ncbi:GAF domain-containing protein [Solwaraspora sp. WMMB335]|uniref:GAF domain-containing protein n=1 Tax=Solwaraspora sp. WMMB335 TaxID=3404118 RepID=UPI003B94AEC1
MAIAAGAAYLLQATPGWPDWSKWVALAAGALLTIGTSVASKRDMSQYAKRLEDAEDLAKQARSSAIESIRSVLEPGLDALMRIASEKRSARRREMAERMKQLIVGLACDIKPNARASYFRCDEEGAARVLRWEEIWKSGRNRNHQPRAEFVEGDKGPGDEMFRMLDSGRPFLVTDVSGLAKHLRRDPRDYETYIAAPVILGSRKFGFLGVDAPGVGELTIDDMYMVQNLANVLAIGLSLAESVTNEDPDG